VWARLDWTREKGCARVTKPRWMFFHEEWSALPLGYELALGGTRTRISACWV